MRTHTIEILKNRRLLSVTLSESEPNDAPGKADALPRVAEELVRVNGKIGKSVDHDWFRIQIKAGDVVGVAVTGGRFDERGLDPYARLLDGSGQLVIENAGPYFTPGDSMADESPRPRADRESFGVEFYRVMPKAGTYYLDVSAYADGRLGEPDAADRPAAQRPGDRPPRRHPRPQQSRLTGPAGRTHTAPSDPHDPRAARATTVPRCHTPPLEIAPPRSMRVCPRRGRGTHCLGRVEDREGTEGPPAPPASYKPFGLRGRRRRTPWGAGGIAGGHVFHPRTPALFSCAGPFTCRPV
jgi:hypothetical protein